MPELTITNGRSIGSLNGDAPKVHELGRRCAGCGCKLSRYNAEPICGACEMSAGKWKSSRYPDGCSACPTAEKFDRAHMGRGLCSRCYMRERTGAKPKTTRREADMQTGTMSREEEQQLEGEGATGAALVRETIEAQRTPAPVAIDEQAEREAERDRAEGQARREMQADADPITGDEPREDDEPTSGDREIEAIAAMSQAMQLLDGPAARARAVWYIADRFAVTLS